MAVCGWAPARSATILLCLVFATMATSLRIQVQTWHTFPHPCIARPNGTEACNHENNTDRYRTLTPIAQAPTEKRLSITLLKLGESHDATIANMQGCATLRTVHVPKSGYTGKGSVRLHPHAHCQRSTLPERRGPSRGKGSHHIVDDKNGFSDFSQPNLGLEPLEWLQSSKKKRLRKGPSRYRN